MAKILKEMLLKLTCRRSGCESFSQVLVELHHAFDLPVELAAHPMWVVNITPTLALRLEAALEISAGGWYEAVGMPMPDLWLLADQMAGELAGIRWRRYRLSHDRRQDGG